MLAIPQLRPKTMNSQHPSPPVNPDPLPTHFEALFDAWIAHVNNTARFGKESIDPEKSSSYQFIWRSWVKFLAERPAPALPVLDPLKARAEDVASFLTVGPLSSKPGRAISPVTKRRYFTVLQRLYAFFAHQQWIAVNPVDQLAIKDRPAQEVHEGAVLTAPQWSACMQLIPQLGSDAFELRNQAIFGLLFRHGLRPEEVRALKLQDYQPDLSSVATVTIQSIRGPEQERKIPLDEATARAIDKWKSARRDLPVVRNCLQKLQDNFDDRQLHEASDTMFVTRISMDMSMASLLYLVKSHIVQACANAGLDQPIRMGPQIVRNTRLCIWLNNGEDVGQVVKRAGLKNAKGLLHLINACSVDVQQKLRPANKRDDQ